MRKISVRLTIEMEADEHTDASIRAEAICNLIARDYYKSNPQVSSVSTTMTTTKSHPADKLSAAMSREVVRRAKEDMDSAPGREG